jgi:hypothetical protein
MSVLLGRFAPRTGRTGGTHRSLCAAAVVALVAAGCGSDAPSGEQVVRAWAAEISRGDVEAASRRFAIPAQLEDASGRTRLVSRRAVRFFHETLPCGARVVATRRLPGALVATFRLVARPGADCDGAGSVAAIVLEIRDGLIERWIRLPDGPTGR